MGLSFAAPLAGRNKRRRPVGECRRRISIHAPLAGRDLIPSTRSARPVHFNPRAPCGARPTPLATACIHSGFQSTRPLRGATPSALTVCPTFKISIHAPLAGRDRPLDYPVSFCRISIHAPLAGRDLYRRRETGAGLRFQSTRPLRGATANLTNSYPQICAKVTKGTC